MLRIYDNKKYIVKWKNGKEETFTGKELKTNERLMYKIMCSGAIIIGYWY